MAEKVALQAAVESDATLLDRLAQPGCKVLEVYATCWGPCTSVLPTLKRLRQEKDDEQCLSFLTCKAEDIGEFEKYRERSQPTFLVYRNGNLKETIVGANTPAIAKAILANVPNMISADDPEANPKFVIRREQRNAAAEAAKGAQPNKKK